MDLNMTVPLMLSMTIIYARVGLYGGWRLRSQTAVYRLL